MLWIYSWSQWFNVPRGSSTCFWNSLNLTLKFLYDPQKQTKPSVRTSTLSFWVKVLFLKPVTGSVEVCQPRDRSCSVIWWFVTFCPQGAARINQKLKVYMTIIYINPFNSNCFSKYRDKIRNKLLYKKKQNRTKDSNALFNFVCK